MFIGDDDDGIGGGVVIFSATLFLLFIRIHWRLLFLLFISAALLFVLPSSSVFVSGSCLLALACLRVVSYCTVRYIPTVQ